MPEREEQGTGRHAHKSTEEPWPHHESGKQESSSGGDHQQGSRSESGSGDLNDGNIATPKATFTTIPAHTKSTTREFRRAPRKKSRDAGNSSRNRVPVTRKA